MTGAGAAVPSRSDLLTQHARTAPDDDAVGVERLALEPDYGDGSP